MEGSGVCLRLFEPLIKPKIGANSVVKRSWLRDCVNRGNESIPSPRHRAKTAPEERSIWLTCWNLSCNQRSWTGLCNSRLTSSLHNRTGENGCLITLDHFERSICTGQLCRIVTGCARSTPCAT